MDGCLTAEQARILKGRYVMDWWSQEHGNQLRAMLDERRLELEAEKAQLRELKQQIKR